MKIILAALLLFTGCASKHGLFKKEATYYGNLKFSLMGKHQVETRARVAVVDTGLDMIDMKEDYMCKDIASVDTFSDHYDYHGHGTNIVSIIAKSMNKEKYCITMVRAHLGKSELAGNYVKSLFSLPNLPNLIMVNMSLEGQFANQYEFGIISQLVTSGVVVNVAAGNSGFNLDYGCGVFPACYAKFFPTEFGLFNVVATNGNYSNYGGPVNFVVQDKLRGKPKMRGTSQGTAYLTGQMLIK